jgi:predicted nucleotidyltransferase
MVTIRTAKIKIENLLADLKLIGYQPTRAILFGSVAKGTAHNLSDVDVAIWDEKFTGCLPEDYEQIAKVLRNHSRVEVHTFHASETKEDNPFIGEIEKTGIEIPVS